MLNQLLMLILDAVFGFLTLLLLARFVMQWLRVSFRNQLGAFILAATDWVVLPARKVIPGLFGLDLSSLVLAILFQTLLLLIVLLLRGFNFGGGAVTAALGVLLLGSLETLKLALYLLMGVVIIAAVLSWVNPYSPLAPLFNALTRPFLKPLQRVIPPLANVDLSPLVLLLILQVVLVLLGSLRAGAFSLLT